jgi:predicted dehydrogenase
MTDPIGGASRRDFLKTSAALGGGAVASTLGFVPSVHAAGSDTIKIGLIGCGGRGKGAAENAAEASENVKLYALGDLFPDHLEEARRQFSKNDKLSGKVEVSDERCFTGFDAYQKVLDSGVDLVILATPPGFRPQHLEAAVKAGKHIFTEKPVAVDGTGIRKVLAAAEEAKRKNLAVVAGTQRRHQGGYVESMKRIHDGYLGEIVSGRCYWNQGGLWKADRTSEMSDMEWQIRNWLYFTWLSGDHICEQHVHNLDVINWALQAVPVKAVGLGGRQVRTDPAYGNIYDHFAIDYEYPHGVHVASYSRQQDGTQGNVSEAVIGSNGRWYSGGYTFQIGHKRVNVRESGRGAYVQEHQDLVDSIRKGEPLNELRQVAESTLTAILGRMAAYTGKEVTWDDALNSNLDTFPKVLAFGPHPIDAVAMPGVTELI